MFKVRLAFHVACALLASAAQAAPLELRVVDKYGKPVQGAVVLLRSTDATRPLAKAVDAKMDQLDRLFVPHVLVVPTGSKVSFPNTDTVRHQVYSLSPAKRFALPLYRGTAYEPQIFDRAGVVTLGCNIHDNMRAYVYVVDGQYFGRTEGNGSWKVADIQPGTYTVQVWNPKTRDTKTVIEQKINVTAAEGRMTLAVATEMRVRPVLQIPGNWDAY